MVNMSKALMNGSRMSNTLGTVQHGRQCTDFLFTATIVSKLHACWCKQSVVLNNFSYI